MAGFDKQRDKLVGSEEEQTGGLSIQKKQKIDDNEETFKKPKVSLFGLDALAREKRKQSAKQHVQYEPKRDSSDQVVKRHRHGDDRDDDRGAVRISFGNARTGRHYR